MARHGFLYQGQWYSWQKHSRGGFAFGLPASRFVSFLENHDQVANTGAGERLFNHADHGRWRALTALLLLGPALPLLFQGQEFGSSRPFAYFAHHDGDLADAVANGRLEFLAQFPGLKTPEMRARIPSPSARDTFERGKLLDAERTTDNCWFLLHRDLLRLRRDDAVLRQLGTDTVRVESSAPTPSLLLVRYFADVGHRLLVVNFADEQRLAMNDPLLAPAPSFDWQQTWTSEQPQYGGHDPQSILDAVPWVVPATSAILLSSIPR